MLDYEISSSEFKLTIINDEADIGGGITTKLDIDKIKLFPDEENVTLMGINQEMLKYFVDTYGKQFKRIRFFKNKRIEDLSPLSRLPQLEYLYFFANQRVTELWDMSKNVSLETLIVCDFSKLNNLRNIDTAPNLKNFFRGDEIWTTAETDSLEPLQHSRIENLGFLFKKIHNPDIEPLIKMKNLKRLEAHPHTFEIEKCVEFSIRRPDVRSLISTPYVEWHNEHIMIVGKRRPMLKKPVDEKKLQDYVDRWNIIKEQLFENMEI